MLVDGPVNRRAHLAKSFAIRDSIFTFNEFLNPGFLEGRRISKVVIDEGLNANAQTIFGIIYKCGQAHLNVQVFGTSQATLEWDIVKERQRLAEDAIAKGMH